MLWLKTKFTSLQRRQLTPHNENIKGNYGGILLSDTTRHGLYSAEFVVHTIRALQLIERVDPRRFSYVQSELRYINNEALISGGLYIRAYHSCWIDFLRFREGLDCPEPEYEWYLALYACLIVHEMTHGRLHSFGIPYNGKTWERIERICRMEEKRFATHLSSENYSFETLVPNFNPMWWRDDRKTPLLRRLRKLRARMREVDGAGHK